MASIRVRFPPSPTGLCHVGTARMAMVNYLFARRRGGTIIFRSEDTDKERSRKEYEDDIVEQLHWLGLDWDEFARTSERVARHKEAMTQLVADNKAYVSKEESTKEPGTFVEVVRLRNPGRSITFSDEIRGDITFDTTELGDFVIGRRIDDPLYHLAVVVDDSDMAITHVIRGEEHISNTPRQILIQEACGFSRPIYAHYPLLLGTDRSKLSKRTGDVAVKQYRDAGYLPEALLNYIGVLGWTPPSGKEILSLEEMVAEFDIKDLHKSGAIFDIEKLRWYNRHYLLAKSDDQFNSVALRHITAALTKRGTSGASGIAERLIPLVKERISVWSDIAPLIDAELTFFFERPKLVDSEIPEKKSSASDAKRHLINVRELLHNSSEESFADVERLKGIVWDYATAEGRGAVLWPLRFALSGLKHSPDPFAIASILGKEETIARIDSAIQILTV